MAKTKNVAPTDAPEPPIVGDELAAPVAEPTPEPAPPPFVHEAKDEPLAYPVK